MKVVDVGVHGKKIIITVALGAFWLLNCWWSLLGVSSELHQGEIYRILYIHVPSAVCAFLAALLLCGLSVYSLLDSKGHQGYWGRAICEVGLLFTGLTLVTGSIWGKPTWGTWWTWDARLTTTLVLALLYSAYLLLHASIGSDAFRNKACAVFGILIFADVPIVYQSVSWWRTLHQPPSIGLSSVDMDPEILAHLGLSVLAMLALALWLAHLRASVLALRSYLMVQSFELALKDSAISSDSSV